MSKAPQNKYGVVSKDNPEETLTKGGTLLVRALDLGLTHPKDVSISRAGTSSFLGKETGNWEELKHDHPPPKKKT